MKALFVSLILMMFVGCGSTYHLKEGGWVIEEKDGEGTCLTVSGDGDPEVVIVCIANPTPIKLSKAVLAKACPKAEPVAATPEPAPPAAAAPKPEATDGAE